MIPVREEWEPEYELSKGEWFKIEGFSPIDECPRSFIPEESIRLVELEARVSAVPGTVFLGVDSSKWPAWWFDVVSTCNHHKNRQAAAQRQAFEDKMNRDK